MRISLLLQLSAVLSLAFVGVEARAQQVGGTSRTSTSNIGGGLSTTGVFGQTQRGGVSNQRSSGFSRGTGSSSSGIGAASNSPLNNLGGADSMLAGRQQQQQGAFVGRGSVEDLGRFIGAANAASQGQGFGGQGANFGGRNQQFGNQGGRGGQNGQFGQFGEGFDNQSAEQVQELRRFRTKLSLGFQPPPAHMTAFTAESTARLSKSLERSVGASVQAQLADEVVVLSGTVATTAEKLLAEQLALLEPGVARVQNDLVVAADRPSDVRSNSSPTN